MTGEQKDFEEFCAFLDEHDIDITVYRNARASAWNAFIGGAHVKGDGSYGPKCQASGANPEQAVLRLAEKLVAEILVREVRPTTPPPKPEEIEIGAFEFSDGWRRSAAEVAQ